MVCFETAINIANDFNQFVQMVHKLNTCMFHNRVLAYLFNR